MSETNSHQPNNINIPPTPEGAGSHESSIENPEQGIIMSGLSRVVEDVRRHREGVLIESIEETVAKIDAEVVSSDVKRNAARRMLIPGRVKSQTTTDPSEDKKNIHRYHSLSDSPDGSMQSLRPITRSEIKAARKVDRKIRANMRKAVVNRTFELTYNEVNHGQHSRLPRGPIAIGTPEHTQMLKNERLSSGRKRELWTAEKSAKKYVDNTRKIQNNIADVENMGRGTGKDERRSRKRKERLGKKVQRKQRKLAKVQQKLAGN